MCKHYIFGMTFAKVYPLYVQKAERKGRTKKEVDQVICWLTGYDQAGLRRQIEQENDHAEARRRYGTVSEYAPTSTLLFNSMATGCAPNTPLNTFPAPLPFPSIIIPAPICMVPIPGDVAVDRGADLIWVTNGLGFAAYSPRGNFIGEFPKPPTLWPAAADMCHQYVRAMGCQSRQPPPGPFLPVAPGSLWVTNGEQFARVMPPVLPNPAGLPGTVVPPGPMDLGLAPPEASDIDYDAATDTLWVGDDIGFVTNLLPTGGMGPFGSFAAAGVCGWIPPALPVTGIAVETASATSPTLFISAVPPGLTFRLLPGATSPPTVYSLDPCNTGGASGGPGDRLGFAARPIHWGGGPKTDMVGQLLTGPLMPPGNSVTLTVEVPAGPTTSSAILFLSLFPLCPPLMWMSPTATPALIHLDPTFAIFFGAGTVTPPMPPATTTGIASVSIPYSTGIPPGAWILAQWIVFDSFVPIVNLSRAQMLTFCGL